MIDQGAQVARAEQGLAAIPAKHVGGAALPVEKKDSLLVLRKHLLKPGIQRPGKHAGVALLKFHAHIHNIHWRQFQAEQLIPNCRRYELGVQADGLPQQRLAVG